MAKGSVVNGKMKFLWQISDILQFRWSFVEYERERFSLVYRIAIGTHNGSQH